MSATVILQILAFAIAEGPEAFNLAVKILDGIKSKFEKPEDGVAALNGALGLLAPMVKEV